MECLAHRAASAALTGRAPYRLETWAVTVTFFGLMTVTISQAMSFGQ
jgi:hypothetical protein